ncbi:bifunctional glycosyltransferase/CDP-glycerol:glycerophosphate glycerophosphotransferase [Nocardioides sp. Soil796]|uniref:bifunctional glycosyltransferase/CDP-glycerol:glycerophosphate glycerophosphotransferase n=1 Tax=Nocardioides sp. Soil796 TaxID=1736412 RepID=UPI00070B089F|nr:glycosyltransferase [Nocardioides sp. Soil796]KRF14901.1 hypothetical protein ASH02_11565 [Nocardioides sp. Soil796]
MSNEARPLFSIVSAVYNVAPYLPDFIASIERQTHGLDDVEILMIDDGSTDESPRLLAEWANRHPKTVRVITQENAGQGAARNTGIKAAHGEWITFPDPDDTVNDKYLQVVADFIEAHPDAHMAATHRLIWNEAEDKVTDRHPLRSMFHANPYVDLSLNPERFHGSSPATFFRLDRIRDLGLEFDGRIRPNFEDGHFNSRYLLSFDQPRVGFLDAARYHYRKRADDSSTLQTAQAHPGRYNVVPKLGYLDLVERARELHGRVPRWLESFLLYELHWYFKATDSHAASTGRPQGGPITDEFHAVAAEILGQIDVDEALRYVPPTVPGQTRLVLAHGYEEQPWHDPFVHLKKFDVDQVIVKASYFYTGDLPTEVWRANGEPIEPLHAKVRDLEFYGRTLMHERSVWLPANRSLQLDLDGAAVDIVYERPYGPTRVAPPGQIRWFGSPLSQRARSRVPKHLQIKKPESRQGKIAQRLMRTPQVRKKYADAWVLMDRVHDAADSGEILFRYLRANHPEINAWFVLEKGGKEWERFRKEGHGDRLVAYGSLQWRLLLAHAKHLLSSHADAAVVAPAEITEFTPRNWRFHFLQHGVIKDDISSWLDPKEMDTFVVSTRQEMASIAGDHTPYVFTTREVALTGLPRFDRLREVGLRFPPDKRDLLLVTPTWRNGLLPPVIKGSQRRELDSSLLESDFVQQWMSYICDDTLAEACRRHGLKLGFLPHPNLQPLLPMMHLPDHVLPLSYEGGDPQELFARARAVVTDFSSIAFNAAYLQRPVVYFQFDADTVLGGGHVGRAGYFEYPRDGFGPVEEDKDSAVAATIQALDHGPDPLPAYQARIDASFQERDGKCCERVVAHVKLTEGNRSRLPAEPTPQMPATVVRP